MTKKFLSDVRDQLASRSTTTSISELKQRGMDQVRVIRSSQVLQLIEEAVDRALVDRGIDPESPDRDTVVQASQQIFREMVQNEMQAPAQDPEMVEQLIRRMQRAESEVDQLRVELVQQLEATQSAEARAAELGAELNVIRQRSASAAPEALLDEL